MIAQVTPVPVPTLSPGHRAKLRSSGLTDDQINQLPHRTVTAAEAKAATGHELPGLLLGYLSHSGKPYQILTGKWAKRPFARLRPDWDLVPAVKRADYANSDGELPKYLSPSGCGSRPYFSPLLDWGKLKPSRMILLTEGEFKGDAGCARGLTVIAGAGVSAFTDRDDRDEWQGGDGSGWDTEEPDDDRMPSSRFLPELESIPWAHRPVGIIFDSDIVQKFQVRKAMESLLTHVRARAGVGFPVLLPNELDGSKNGLDDFLERHGSEAVELIIEAFWSQQHNKQAMAKYGPAGKFKGGTKIIGGRDETGAPHAGNEVCCLKLLEPEPHTKALMTWSVLKERWAYRPALGWYRWNGKHWEPMGDNTAMGVEIGRFFDAQNWQQRNEGLYEYCQKEMARRCYTPDDRWDSPHYLTFENGILDTRTNQFKPHDPAFFCTSKLPYDYDPFAQCPRWLDYLSQATGGDASLITLLRAWCKWAIVPKDRSRKSPVEKSLDLVGRKGSGKGTFLDILMQLVGEDSCASASPETFSTPEGLGQLIDKRLAIDTDASGFMPGVGNFNKVVSNEPVGIKKLFKDKAMQRLGVVVVRSYNDFISVPSSGTEGLDRRLCIIPFRYPPTVPDHDLDSKLRAEMPGIFSWAWSLSLPQAQSIIRWSGAIGAVQEVSIDRFLNDHSEVKYLIDDYPAGKESVQAFDLYEGYVSWAKRNGHKPCSNTKFGILINELELPHYKGNGGCIFYNIPDMRHGFDLASYLRITPKSADQLPIILAEVASQDGKNPPKIQNDNQSIQESPDLRRVSEGFGGSESTQKSCPASVSEGSEGLRSVLRPAKKSHELVADKTQPFSGNTYTPRWEPSDKPIERGSMVEQLGEAIIYKQGSFKIADRYLLNQHKEAESVPIDMLPEWAKEGLLRHQGPWKVDSISADRTRATIRLRDGRSAVVGTVQLYAVEEVQHG
jgi:putative DNA primase/helicase